MTRALHRIEVDEIAAGVDSTIVIPLWDSNNDALDPTGMTASWKIYKARSRHRSRPFRGTAKATKTSAAGQIALATGSATVTITDTDLVNEYGEYWQVLELTTTASGAIAHRGSGPVRILGNPA